jgi:hypothetical protein
MYVNVLPGNEDLKAGGESSFKWIGMTPHAPCTKNWIMKPLAERPPSECGKIHAGIKRALISAEETIDLPNRTVTRLACVSDMRVVL